LFLELKKREQLARLMFQHAPTPLNGSPSAIFGESAGKPKVNIFSESRVC
jgi:hypothetical protein